jgi:hypothetical protein
VNLEVSLSGASGQNVTVNYSVTGGTATGGGTDYTIAAGPLTIPAGSTSGNIVLNIVDDTLDEPNETVIVTISGATNATLGSTTQHTYTIIDNDAQPTVQFSSSTSNGCTAYCPIFIEHIERE